MQVHLSVVLVLAVAVGWPLRTGELRPAHTLAAVLLGFYLAHSSLAPAIHAGLESVESALAGVHL